MLSLIDLLTGLQGGGGDAASLVRRAGKPATPMAPGGTVPSAPPSVNPLAPSAPPEDSMPRDLPASPSFDLSEPKHGGIFGRIRDFVTSDEGRAALLRSGAATIDGGIGAGISAGANYVDQRHATMAARDAALQELALKDRGLQIDQQRADAGDRQVQNNYDLGVAEQGNKATANDIAAYRAKTEAMLRRAGIDVDLKKIEQDDKNNQRNNDTSRRGQDLSYDATTRGQDLSYGSATRGQDNARYIADLNRAGATGDKVATTTVQPAESGGFFGTAKPAETTISQRTTPNYGEIRVDPATGKKYRLDAFTGKTVLVP